MKVFLCIFFKLVKFFLQKFLNELIQNRRSYAQDEANKVASPQFVFRTEADKDENSDSDSPLESHEDIAASVNENQVWLLGIKLINFNEISTIKCSTHNLVNKLSTASTLQSAVSQPKYFAVLVTSEPFAGSR